MKADEWGADFEAETIEKDKTEIATEPKVIVELENDFGDFGEFDQNKTEAKNDEQSDWTGFGDDSKKNKVSVAT